MTHLRENVKLALLGQSLCVKAPRRYNSKCFMKIACMEKYTFLRAKAYQFRMNFGQNGEVKFSFVSQENDEISTAAFQLSYERAERFVEMLDPCFFYVCVEHDIQSEFLSLISLTTGKLALELCEHARVPNVLKTYWKHLDELICFPEMFELIDEWALEPKVFDKLTLKVRGISKRARLALTLKQKAKILDFGLCLDGFHGSDFPLSRAVVNDVATGCRLHIESISAERIMRFVNTVANACQKLEHFEIHTTEPDDRTPVGTFGDFLDIFADDYGECVRLTESLKDTKFASKINFCPYDLAQFLIPDNWEDQLKVRLGVEEVAFEEIRDYLYGKVTRISLVSKHGQSEFKFSTRIKYRDEETDTLYD